MPSTNSSSSFGELKNMFESIQVTDANRPMFKGTLAIIIIYATLVVGIVIFGSTKAGEALATTFYPFTVTFILGTLVVVIFMLYTFVSKGPAVRYEPSEMAEAAYKCPDFYKLIYNPSESNVNHRVVCVPSDVLSARSSATLQGNETATSPYVYNSTSETITIGGASASSNLYQFVNLTNILPESSEGEHTCAKIFPNLIREKEARITDEATKVTTVFTDLRCQYAAACGTNWSALSCGYASVNPDDPTSSV